MTSDTGPEHEVQPRMEVLEHLEVMGFCRWTPPWGSGGLECSLGSGGFASSGASGGGLLQERNPARWLRGGGAYGWERPSLAATCSNCGVTVAKRLCCWNRCHFTSMASSWSFVYTAAELLIQIKTRVVGGASSPAVAPLSPGNLQWQQR